MPELKQLLGTDSLLAIKDYVDTVDSGKEDKENKTTILSDASTDTQYPSAKAVVDYVDGAVSDLNIENGSGTNSLQQKGCTASGDYSFAEGKETIASNNNSHAEGVGSVASGDSSHAEGVGSVASGEIAHSEGDGTTASGYASHAEGIATVADHDYQHVSGKYNENKETTLLEVGNGSGVNHRSNAFEVHQDGHVEVGAMGSTDKSVATKEYVDTNKGTKLWKHTLSNSNGSLVIISNVAEAFDSSRDHRDEIISCNYLLYTGTVFYVMMVRELYANRIELTLLNSATNQLYSFTLTDCQDAVTPL